MIEPPAPDEFAPFYAGYVARVPEGDIVDTLARQIDGTIALLAGLEDGRAGFRYAPDKWSVRQVVGHLSDSERVFATRALRFARADTTALPGFDEKRYVATGGFDDRSLADLVAEFRAVRAATVALLRGLPADAWTRAGTANQARVSVRALAWITAGHELHHREILRDRYGLGTG